MLLQTKKYLHQHEHRHEYWHTLRTITTSHKSMPQPNPRHSMCSFLTRGRVGGPAPPFEECSLETRLPFPYFLFTSYCVYRFLCFTPNDCCSMSQVTESRSGVMVGERLEVGRISFDETNEDHIGSCASPMKASTILSLLHLSKENLA